MSIDQSEHIPGESIYLHDSSGRDIRITKAEILDYFSNSTAIDRQNDTITWMKDRIVAALGDDVISAEYIFTDFDTDTGAPTQIETISG